MEVAVRRVVVRLNASEAANFDTCFASRVRMVVVDRLFAAEALLLNSMRIRIAWKLIEALSTHLGLVRDRLM